jgi:hypothetical protein
MRTKKERTKKIHLIHKLILREGEKETGGTGTGRREGEKCREKRQMGGKDRGKREGGKGGKGGEGTGESRREKQPRKTEKYCGKEKLEDG